MQPYEELRSGPYGSKFVIVFLYDVDVETKAFVEDVTKNRNIRD